MEDEMHNVLKEDEEDEIRTIRSRVLTSIR